MHISFSFFQVLPSTKSGIFLSFAQVDSLGWSVRCYSGFNFTCLGSLPIFIWNDVSFWSELFFQGVEPVDYGPGSNWQQGPQTRTCSPVLVPSMQRTSRKSPCSHFRTRVTWMHGGWRYFLPSLLLLYFLLRYTNPQRNQIIHRWVLGSGKKFSISSLLVCQWTWL